MKSVLVTLALALVLGTAAFGQSVKDDLTWTELKLLQKEEAATLHSRQESEFKLLLDIQKTQLHDGPGTGANMNDLTKLLTDEREKALAKYADERKTLSQRQGEERSTFLACNKKTDNKNAGKNASQKMDIVHER